MKSEAENGPRWLAWFALAVVAAAAGIRIYFLIQPDASFLRTSPVSEDAYYAFGVSRHLGAGRGMTFDGHSLTNGFQPLSTFLGALPFWAAPADPILGIRIFLVFSFACTLVVAWMVGRLTRVAGGRPATAALASAVYLMSPLSLSHDMNGLDTGCSTILLIASVLYYARTASRGGWGAMAVLGVLLGLLTLARIDNGFAVVLFGALHVTAADRGPLRRRLGEAALFCAIAGAVLAPWLIANYVLFGNFMPMSGQTSMKAPQPTEQGVVLLGPDLGSNIKNTVIAFGDHPLFTAFMPALRRLAALGAAPAAIALAACAGVIAYIASWRRPDGGRGSSDPTVQRLLWVLPFIYFAILGLIYISFFRSAEWFISRYLFPAAVWTFPAVCVGMERLFASVSRRLARPGLLPLLLAAWLAVNSVAAWRWFGRPRNEQYVDFAMLLKKEYPGKRIAMFQAGTCGYICSDLVNLDGKVNPEVRPYFKTGRLADYVAARDFDVVADWPAIVDPLMASPALRDRYRKRTEGAWSIYERIR
jgi:hypothetical protein